MAQRYQREIEEILGKVNEDQPAETGAAGSARPRRAVSPKPPSAARRSSRFRLNFSPGRMLITGVALLFAALLFLAIAPALAQPAAWVGIGLFVLAYVLFFVKPRRTVERRWRGQSIEDPVEPNPLERLWRWVSRG